MQITQIRLKNFRAFQNVEMRDIPQFAILVGANGTGKSTLFSVFNFLREAMTSNVTTALTKLGGSRGQVFVSTHSPDFLNSAKLDEVFWLKKESGYTTVQRAKDNEQISAYMDQGAKMGHLWQEGFFPGADPQ